MPLLAMLLLAHLITALYALGQFNAGTLALGNLILTVVLINLFIGALAILIGYLKHDKAIKALKSERRA